MNNIEDIRISRNMKYEALYWALGFIEIKNGLYKKVYKNDYSLLIFADDQYVDFDDKISIVNSNKFSLKTHKSFVILECIDKLLSMGYKPSEIIIDTNNEYDIYLKDFYIKCFEWSQMETNDSVEIKKDVFKSVRYTSRLYSGVIERKTYIKDYTGKIYNGGIFESAVRLQKYNLYLGTSITNEDFVIENNTVYKYFGKSKKVIIPNGVTNLASCLFWDNQEIEEVVLPNSLINIGGDTFYNCKNLMKVIIPENVEFMGNNPFAGCPKLELINKSKYFNQIQGALYNNSFTKLIYYPINNPDKNYVIDSRTNIIGKHSFYMCNNLEQVIIPESVIKLENNPFSGCTKLDVINNSCFYHIIDKVIYNKEKTSVIGCLNSIETDELRLLNVKRICRNSFWNCKGIKKIILPTTLEDIGYNPFVSCNKIEFENLSDKFTVENGVLFNKDTSKLICYPSYLAIGEISIPAETIILERGAFSGCDMMTKINLHNVSIISKTGFTNCNSLEHVYCSDLVSYIGEWAFAHCDNLKEISIFKDCYVDNNATLNTETVIKRRDIRSNYVIESENLYTLSTMLNSYRGVIDSILIDPPYNSNISYIGYKDNNFKGGYQNFINERLKISYELLSDKGSVVINIDECGLSDIVSVCKSIFKSVKVYKWEKLHPYFDTNRDTNSKKKKVLYEFIVICNKNSGVKLNKIMQPFIEENTLKEKKASLPKVLSCFGTTSSAKDEIAKIFGTRDYFSTPKPIKLMKELIRATTNKNSIILDYFAGSGTTGHAAVELNNEDGGNRKYILVSNNESNICEKVTIKRMSKIDPTVMFLS